MCVMVAFAGNEPAAPVLLRVLQNMEGYGGGHFTGVATLHEGKLHFAKVCGDTRELLARTDVLNLPGNVGIAHSRTPGFHDSSFAHPFVTYDETIAYVANGAKGGYKDKVDLNAIHERLLSEGMSFRSESRNPDNHDFPPMSNGNVMHVSDLMCGLIAEKHNRQGYDLATSMRMAFTEAPSEISGLSISVKEPGQVTACRLNKPLMWAHKPGASYLATTALGLVEENIDHLAPLPIGTSAVLKPESLTTVPFDGPLGRSYTRNIPWAQAAKIIEVLLADRKPHHIGELCKSLRCLWPGNSLDDDAMLAYQYVYDMVVAGRLQVVRMSAPASLPGAQAPRWLFQRV